MIYVCLYCVDLNYCLFDEFVLDDMVIFAAALVILCLFLCFTFVFGSVFLCFPFLPSFLSGGGTCFEEGEGCDRDRSLEYSPLSARADWREI